MDLEQGDLGERLYHVDHVEVGVEMSSTTDIV